MTKRELKYLFIIHTLAMYQHRLIADTNAFVEQVEAQANEKLQARVKELSQADTMTLEAVWQERESYRLELERLQQATPKVHPEQGRRAGKPKKWKVAE